MVSRDLTTAHTHSSEEKMIPRKEGKYLQRHIILQTTDCDTQKIACTQRYGSLEGSNCMRGRW